MLMISSDLIEKVKNLLVRAYNPLEIYLFGSYAWGHPSRDSDLDLVIVVEKSNEKNYKRPLIAYDALVDIDVPTDIIVYTKDEFENKSRKITTLCYKIKNEGKRIYARA